MVYFDLKEISKQIRGSFVPSLRGSGQQTNNVIPSANEGSPRLG